MRASSCIRTALACFLLAAPIDLAEAAEAAINLLELPQVELVASSLVGDPSAQVSAVTDASAQTVGRFEAAGGESIDLVFGFAGETVAAEAVVVQLAGDGAGAAPARMDVLASTVSPHSGFRSLRADPIDRTAEQRFRFRPVAARWIMIRLTPARDAREVALAEIGVLGRLGPPETVYAFSETPARAIDVLARLETASAVAVGVSSEEQRAFDLARAGRLDPQTLAEVALIASGVADAGGRQRYLGRIDALEARARRAVGTAGDPADRGGVLLRWLHEEVLTTGYRSSQTDLSVLLDDGTFNCVSSAVIYNILALRLGLDARAIEVPDHAFSIVYDGTNHMDVETTTPRGFDPARDQIAEFERLTGFRYIPQSHQDRRREITEAGLAALIYYNKGVELSRAKRHHDALLAYFRAMSLDPEFASAVKNALAALANWSAELAGQGQWEKALDVAAVGVALAPRDAVLANNHEAVWSGWASALAEAGRRGEAVAVLKRAAEALPDAGFEAMEAWIYIKPGEELAKAEKWEAAFAATEAGLAELDAAPRQDLVDWRNGLFLRWANAEIASRRFEAAATVLARGLAAVPGDRRLAGTVAYLGQEWAQEAAAKGYGEGLAVLAALARRFPGNARLARVAKTHVWRSVERFADAGRIDEGIAALDAAQHLFDGDAERREIGEALFDKGARGLIEARDFEQAAALYARGLDLFPDSRLLRNNVAYLAQEWQKAAFAAGGAEAVAAVAEKLALRFPALDGLAQIGVDQIRRSLDAHVRAQDFEAALQVLKAAADRLGPQDMEQLNEHVYDSWARAKMAAGDWQGAADLYAAGLAAAGSSRLLKNNAAYLVQEWMRAAFADGGVKAMVPVARMAADSFPELASVREAPAAILGNAVSANVKAGEFAAAVALVDEAREVLPAREAKQLYEYGFNQWAKRFIDAEEWREAIEVYDKGLERVPDSRLFKQNREYCLARQG